MDWIAWVVFGATLLFVLYSECRFASVNRKDVGSEIESELAKATEHVSKQQWK